MICLYQFSIFFSVITLNVISAGQSLRGESDPLWYLNKFGYLNNVQKKFGSLRMLSPYKNNPNDLQDAVRKFQKNAGLNPSGILDNATLTMMRLPRCGHPDNLSKNSKRANRYFYFIIVEKKIKNAQLICKETKEEEEDKNIHSV